MVARLYCRKLFLEESELLFLCERKTSQKDQVCKILYKAKKKKKNTKKNILADINRCYVFVFAFTWRIDNPDFQR